jgi:glutathione peroxidase-family protein
MAKKLADFSLRALAAPADAARVSLSKYNNKVVLLCNVASL